VFNNKTGFFNDFDTFSRFFLTLLPKISEIVLSHVFELFFVVFTLSECKMQFFLESFTFFSHFQVPSSIFALFT
jgi:hypothetical protein